MLSVLTKIHPLLSIIPPWGWGVGVITYIWAYDPQ